MYCNIDDVTNEKCAASTLDVVSSSNGACGGGQCLGQDMGCSEDGQISLFLFFCAIYLAFLEAVSLALDVIYPVVFITNPTCKYY